jgi:hypothetical protein
MDRKELMKKADELSLEYKKNISNADLEIMVEQAEIDKSVKEKMAEIEAKTKDMPKIDPVELKKELTEGEKKALKREKALILKRVIVTSMDKNKSEIDGEFISAGSSLIGGMIKKFVPFNREWHVPTIIYDTLKEKKMHTTMNRKAPNGVVVKEDIEVPAYSIVDLPPLTQEELDSLRTEMRA